MIGLAVDRTERFYKIDQLLHELRVVSFATLQRELEVSRATLKRDLEYMRSRLNAPITYDRTTRGYTLSSNACTATRYELPGLWFSAAEIHALLTLEHLVANLRAGSVLNPHVARLKERLQSVLGDNGQNALAVQKRVRILDMASRHVELRHFETLGSALVERKRVHLTYFGRARGDVSERVVSPQRLVHYRDNWYLDAYCHLRKSLRSFSVDAVRSASILDEPARDIADAKLDAALGAGYGIFSGEKVNWAKLRFSPQRARWVAAERWHPRQRGGFDSSGAYVLELPYSDARELVMDILRHGAHVEVLAPEELRNEVRATIDAMRALYTPPD
jgi:predicted DNA-binding transcriptional regulator YafY